MSDSLHTVYIGVGSNIGRRADNCRKGISAIGACDGCLLEAQSPLYETEPVGFEAQDWFVNGVARVRTRLEPEPLLAQLRAIESAMGRRPGGARFGPRILDLDILFFDDRVVRTSRMQLPHPRLHKRRFVLRPLCDIAPEHVHPVLGQMVRSLLSNLNDSEHKVMLHE
ncbi:MAG: 2-amino-4-hydroxy-6-hydroxymethyldihydropteridine diphosphokinase [Desulfobacterales bacterium]|nr:2-amino-4-hydroxy-6-hydroxymethyldihydropteridine diphosphokinase [Desulfobacterales bacterium]